MYKKKLMKFRFWGYPHRNLTVDVRKGRGGFYPGDEIIGKKDFLEVSDTGLVIGVSVVNNALVLCASSDADKELVFELRPGSEELFKLVRRHGQKLIDKGEMVMS